MLSSILLAAGFSTRMGKPKALLDWGNEPLIAYQVNQLHAAGCDEVIVVLGHRGDEIQRAMRSLDCRVMLNARFQIGRASSLRLGAKAVSRDADAILITSVDQPRPADFLRRLVAALQPGHAGVRPVYNGHHGHPIVLSGTLREELMTVTEESDGLLAIVRAHASELNELAMPDDLLALDINTPDD
ncbi:MAG: nucleotidyltransferase family protein, partial [Anaerolineaceae bacterium]